MNVQNICRICLENDSDPQKFTSVFSSVDNVHFSVMIMACACVQVLEDDGLPQMICCDCINKLNIAFQFKQTCESSDLKLRQYFSNQTQLQSQILQVTPDLSGFNINIKDEYIVTTENVQSLEEINCNKNSNSEAVIVKLELVSQTEEQTKNQSNEIIFQSRQTNVSPISEQFVTYTQLQPLSENSVSSSLTNISRSTVKRVKTPKKFNKNIPESSKVKITKEVKIHQCDTCGKTFNRREYLTQHIRIHTGEKPYICHLCDKRFINSGHLTTHMRTHTGEKPHPCNICPKAFSTRQELHKHTMVHNGERPFVCKMCSKRFGSSSNLYSHLKHHTGEKNFTCERCGKAFYSKQELKQHSVVHTGEKAFLCDYCNKRFSQIAHLRRHSKLHKA